MVGGGSRLRCAALGGDGGDEDGSISGSPLGAAEVRSQNSFNPALLLQERQRLHPNLLCHLLQALEGEVAFTSFHSAHVGAVDTKNVCEGFLAQASLQPVGTQVPAHRLLEITNSHISQPDYLLLEGLQTDE